MSDPTTAERRTNSNSHSAGRYRAQVPNFRERCMGNGFALALRLLSSTWRVECAGLELLDKLEHSAHRHILAFWHRHYIALYRLFHYRPTVAVTNRSHRGQVIAHLCHRSGMRTLQVEGRGTKSMLESLRHGTEHGAGLGIAVDGPLGPTCEVKQVVIHLASRLACPIVPVSVAAASKHVFAKRWDQLEVPHFFSRVSFVIGDPILVSSRNSRADLRELAVQLRNTIDRGTERARQRLDAAGRG